MNSKTLGALALLIAMPFPGALAQDNPFAANSAENPFAAAQSDRYVGIFESSAVRLTLARDGDGFSGDLFYAQTAQTYPATARVDAGALRGSFNAGGKSFPFTFAMGDDGDSGQFDTEGYSGKLTRTFEPSSLLKKAAPTNRVDALYEEALKDLESAVSAQKSVAMTTVIAQIAQGGRVDKAKALLDAIPRSDTFRDLAFAMFGESQAINGDLEGARATANGMADQTWRTHIGESIATYQAENGDVSDALATANAIGTQIDKISALVAVANALSAKGDKANALATLTSANEVAQAIQDKERRRDAIGMVSGGYAIMGDYDTASDLADDLKKGTMKRVRAYVNIALARAKAGDMEGSAESNRRALFTIGWMKPMSSRPAAHAQVVRGYAAVRDEEGINKMFKRTRKVKGNPLHVRVELVRTQIQFGYYAPARANLAIVGNADLVGSLTAELAHHQAQHGDFEGGLTMARSVAQPHHRAFAIAAVATEMAKAEK